MNKQTRGRPLLFILCLLFGIALFLIHNLMMPFSTGNSTASDEGVSYLQQAQNQQSESDKKQSNALSVLGSDNQDATSRGQSVSRYIDRDQNSRTGQESGDPRTEQGSGLQAGSSETQPADSTDVDPASAEVKTAEKAMSDEDKAAEKETTAKTAAAAPAAQAMTPAKEAAPETTAEFAAEKSDPA